MSSWKVVTWIFLGCSLWFFTQYPSTPNSPHGFLLVAIGICLFLLLPKRFKFMLPAVIICIVGYYWPLLST